MSVDTTPEVAINHLDHLWFQVAGTRCNLTCSHCFISCSPHNRSLEFLSLADVRRYLGESLALGTKEYYFTGGEPFLNPEMVPILCETLQLGPATVLTNATVLKPEWLEILRSAEASSVYSLEFRVSIDGFSPATNDPIRGEGTFDRAMQGLVQLVEAGFLPIVTAARTWSDSQDAEIVGEFTRMLQRSGYAHPRIKLLPTLRIGAEEHRTCGYRDSERVTSQMMEGFDRSKLVCHHGRMVTSRGVYVCPILVESAGARLGASLGEAMRPFRIEHGACFTCFQHGAICSNSSV